MPFGRQRGQHRRHPGCRETPFHQQVADEIGQGLGSHRDALLTGARRQGNPLEPFDGGDWAPMVQGQQGQKVIIQLKQYLRWKQPGLERNQAINDSR